ncbi:hypothetical protein L9F63_007027, partial [Diploptera punctata]
QTPGLQPTAEMHEGRQNPCNIISINPISNSVEQNRIKSLTRGSNMAAPSLVLPSFGQQPIEGTIIMLSNNTTKVCIITSDGRLYSIREELLNERKSEDIRLQPKNQHEQQVPAFGFLSVESFIPETTQHNNISNCNLQCLSPSSSEDLDQSLFSPPPPQYRNYAYSLSTGTPSPMSTSTDTSSICWSPPRLSLDSTEENCDAILNELCSSRLPTTFTNATYDCSISYPVDSSRITYNINNDVQNYTSYIPSNHVKIIQGPEIPNIEQRTALERMNLTLDERNNAMRDLARYSDERLSKPDKDGDTKILIMIARRSPISYKDLYGLVTRLSKIPGALAAKNLQKQSALLLACLFRHENPLVARFIAEELQNLNHDLNE